MGGLKKLASKVNNNLNPYKSARDKKHQTKEEFVASMLQKTASALAELKSHFDEERRKLAEAYKTLDAETEQEKQTKAQQLADQRTLLDLSMLAVQDCASDATVHLEKLSEFIKTHPHLKLDEFMFCNPLGLTIIFGANKSRDFILNNFAAHIVPELVTFNGETLLDYLQYCDSQDVIKQILELNTASNAAIAKKQAAAKLIEKLQGSSEDFIKFKHENPHGMQTLEDVQKFLDIVTAHKLETSIAIASVGAVLGTVLKFGKPSDLAKLRQAKVAEAQAKARQKYASHEDKRGYSHITYVIHEFINSGCTDKSLFITIQQLLTCGIDVFSKDSKGNSAFSMILASQDEALIFSMIDKTKFKSADLSALQSTLHGFRTNPTTPSNIITLLEYGLFKARLDGISSDIYASIPETGETMLTTASKLEDGTFVTTVIQLGAVVHQPNAHGATPLLTAVAANNLSAVKTLVANGANIHLPATIGKETTTPLAFAQSHGIKAIADYLAASDIFINQLADAGFDAPIYDSRNAAGFSVITFAAHSSNFELINWLYETGLDINQPDTNGKSALTLAIEDQNITLIRWLLENGAIPKESDLDLAEKIADSHNSTTSLSVKLTSAFELQTESEEIYELLYRWKLDDLSNLARIINLVQIGSGETPLTAAIKANNIAEARFLIHQGAKLDSANGAGETPLVLLNASTNADMRNLLFCVSSIQSTQAFQVAPDTITPQTQQILDLASDAISEEQVLRLTASQIKLYPYVPTKFQVQRLGAIGDRFAYQAIQTFVGATLTTSEALQTDYETGDVTVLGKLSKESSSSFLVKYQHDLHRSELVVLEKISNPKVIKFLKQERLLRTAPRNGWIAREYFPGVDLLQAFYALQANEDQNRAIAALIFMIANAFFRLHALHEEGVTVADCTLDKFIWNADRNCCQIASYKSLIPLTSDAANRAIIDLCEQFQDAFPDMPVAVKELLRLAAHDPIHTNLESLAKQIQKQAFSELHHGKRTFGTTRLVVAKDLTSAKDISTAPHNNLDKALVRYYVENSDAIIPARISQALRYLIQILRQEPVADLDALLEDLDTPLLVNGTKIYHLDEIHSDVYAACLQALQALSPKPAYVLRDPKHLKDIVEHFIRDNRANLPDNIDTLDPIARFLLGFCYLYKIDIRILQDDGTQLSLKCHNPTATIVLKYYDGKYCTMSTADPAKYSSELVKLLQRYYAQKTPSPREAIQPDFTTVHVKGSSSSYVMAIIRALELLENPPDEYLRYRGKDIKATCSKIRAAIGVKSEIEALQFIADTFNINLDVYSSSKLGMHSMRTPDGKVTSIVKLNRITASGKPKQCIALLKSERDSTAKVRVSTYAALQLNKQSQWVSPPGFSDRLHYYSDICIIPESSIPAARIEKAATRRIQHIFEGNLHTTLVTTAYTKAAPRTTLYLVEDSSHVCTEAFLASVGLALNRDIQALDVRLETSATPAEILQAARKDKIKSKDLDVLQIYGVYLVESAALNGDIVLLRQCIEAKLDLHHENSAGQFPVIEAALAEHWDVMQAIIVHCLKDNNFAPIYAFDSATGRSLLQILEENLDRATLTSDADKIKAAKELYQMVSLLQFLDAQGEIAEPTTVCAVAATLYSNGWISRQVFEKHELRAQYFQLITTPESAGGLAFSADEYSALAMLLRVRFAVKLNGKLQSFGEATAPYVKVGRCSNKSELIKEAIAQGIDKGAVSRATKPEDILASVAILSTQGISQYTRTELIELKGRIAPSLAAVRRSMLRDDFNTWITKLPDFIKSSKESYEQQYQDAIDQIEKFYADTLQQLDTASGELEPAYQQAQRDMEAEFQIAIDQGIHDIDAKFKAAKHKMTKSLLITLPAVAAAYYFAGPVAAKGFGISEKTMGYAAIRGAMVGLASSAANGKFDPKTFAIGVLGAMAGFQIGEAVKDIGVLDKISREFYTAAGTTLAVSALEGDFSNILQRAIITGTVQVASSAIADKLVPMTTTTAAGVEVKIDSLSMEVANNFIVGTSAAVLSAVSERLIWDNEIDLSQSLIAGLQAALIHLADVKAQEELAREKAREAVLAQEKLEREAKQLEDRKKAEEELLLREQEREAEIKKQELAKRRAAAKNQAEYDRRRSAALISVNPNTTTSRSDINTWHSMFSATPDQVASSIGLGSHSSNFDLDASITSFMVDPMARPIVGRANALGILEHAELTAGMFIGSMYSVAETAFDTAHGISTAMPGGHVVARALGQPTLTQQLTAATFTISQNGFMPIWAAKKAEVKTGLDSAIGNFDAGNYLGAGIDIGYTGSSIVQDVVAIGGLGAYGATRIPRIGRAYAQPKRLASAEKLTKGQLVEYLQNIDRVSMNQLASDLEKVGFRLLERRPDKQIYKFSHVKRELRGVTEVKANLESSKVMVEIHFDAKSGPHMHITDAKGHVYDKYLNDLTSKFRKDNPSLLDKQIRDKVKQMPDAHIKIKEFVELNLRMNNE